MKKLALVFVALALCFVAPTAYDAIAGPKQKSFADEIGNVTVGEVSSTSKLRVPCITWGGDMVTFYANGTSLKTKSGSIFDGLGLDMQIVCTDDFHQQVRDYMSGKSPFLRGTYRMVRLASEVIGEDPRTQGVVLTQMSWSRGGDNLVVRENINSAADLKGKTVLLQRGGPHIGMLDDILSTAGLKWSDVKIVWTKDLSGTKDSPAEKFKKNKRYDAAFVITPDMLALTGGRDQVGSGAEGTVRGAKVLVSTAELSRSIADVYIVRKDFYDANTDLVHKFVAGYLKAAEEVTDLKAKYDKKQSAPKYKKLLKFAMKTYGSKTLPTEADADGLFTDCQLVGYAGNMAFFKDTSNKRGFDTFSSSSLAMAKSQGFIKAPKHDLLPSPVTWGKVSKLGKLKYTSGSMTGRFDSKKAQKEIEGLDKDEMDSRTIYSFTITFEPNQTDFTPSKYGKDFKKAALEAQKYGGAVIVIRGHSDPTMTLKTFVIAGMKKGIIKRSGTKGNYTYTYNGRQLDLTSTEDIVKLIESGAFDGLSDANPRELMTKGLNLSQKRAEAVRSALFSYAKSAKITVDKTQIRAQGVGIREPVNAKPKNRYEAAENQRVEFRIVRVSTEATKAGDFDF